MVNNEAIEAFEKREAEDSARVENGLPSRLPQEWHDRPRLSTPEAVLFAEFIRLAQSCGGEVKPTEVRAWLEMRDTPISERSWMAQVFGAMSAVLRERKED